jgi:hypothetical protein
VWPLRKAISVDCFVEISISKCFNVAKLKSDIILFNNKSYIMYNKNRTVQVIHGPIKLNTFIYTSVIIRRN